MGQYYKIVNINKKEYMSPADWGIGTKLMEFACPTYPSIATSALAILLAEGNNRGGGDLRSNHPIIGSWAYDRVVVIGDYADLHPEIGNVYGAAETWTNVSEDVLTALSFDVYFADDYKKSIGGTVGEHWLPNLVIGLAHKYDPQNTTDNAYIFFHNLYPDEAERMQIVDLITRHHDWEYRNTQEKHELSLHHSSIGSITSDQNTG